MRLHNKILLGYLALASLVAGVGAGSYVTINAIRGEFEQALLHTQPVFEALQQIRYQATRLTLSGATSMAHIELAPEFPPIKDEALVAAVEHYETLVARYFPDEKPLAAEVRRHADALRAVLASYPELASAPDQHAAMHWVINESYGCLGALNEVLETALAGERAEIAEHREAVEEQGDRQVAALAGFSVLAFLMAFASAALLTHGLSRPLEKLCTTVARYGRGELGLRVQDPGKDEVGELGARFNAMADELAHTLVSRDYVEAIIESVADGIVVVGADGLIERSNSAMRAISRGFAPGPLVGRALTELLAPAERVEHMLAGPFLKQGFEFTLNTSTGEAIAVAVTASLIEQGEQRGGYVLLVSELGLQGRSGTRLASANEAPGGLPERQRILEGLRESLAQAELGQESTGVLMYGFDRMPAFAAALGRPVAETALLQASQRIRALMRPEDQFGRWCDDRFVLVLRDLAGIDDLAAIGQSLLEELSAPLHVGQHQMQGAVSIGIACAPLHGSDAELLVAGAELAMLAARSGGGLRCVRFQPLPALTDEDAPDSGRRFVV